MALVIGQLVGPWQPQKLVEGAGTVLTMIVFSFWLGGIVSFFATSLSRVHSFLLVNAAFFWLVGASLIYFLVHERMAFSMYAWRGYGGRPERFG
jgi:hypothetical protein